MAISDGRGLSAREVLALSAGRPGARRMLGGVVDEGQPVVRWRRRDVDGQLVTLGHLRLWMAAVPQYGGREGSDRWWRYVEGYAVPGKIARHLEAGTFYGTVLKGLMQHGRSDSRTIRFVQRAARAWR